MMSSERTQSFFLPCQRLLVMVTRVTHGILTNHPYNTGGMIYGMLLL